MTIIDDTTTTTGPELVLTPDSLTLVRVSPDYFTTGDQHHLMPNGDDESRTYYATTSRTFGPDSEWGVILVDWEADPRGRIGWRAGVEYAGLVDNPDTHGGWNIRRQYLTPVVDSSAVDSSPLKVGDVVRVSDDHPADDWRGLIGTVTAAPTYPGRHLSIQISDDSPRRAGQAGGFRAEYLTRVPSEASREAPTGPETADSVIAVTFTQDDVDRLVDEARRAARAEAEQRFEDWKERASEIACQYADDNSLCGEFERCMGEIGLQGRNREYEVTVTMRVTVEARNEDEAEEQAREIISDDSYYRRLVDATFDVEEA